jgi:hypothetical protein
MLIGILSSDDLLAIGGNKYDYSSYSTYELTGFDDWTELFTYDKDGKVIPDNMVEIFLREIDPISVIFLGEDRYEVILEEDIEGFDDLFEEYDETTKHK